MKNDSIYTINNLYFSYSKNTMTIEINSYEFRKNNTTCIYGPNGSGKTTLFKILNGLIPVKSDMIFFEKQSIEKDNYKNIRLKTVYQHQIPYLLSGSVYDNIAFGLKLRKKPSHEIKIKVQKIIELFELDHLALKNSRDLSEGEKQLTAIARSFAIAPHVLMLDEPTANLDEKASKTLERILMEIQKTNPITLLVCTHDFDFGNKIAHETLSIQKGRIMSSC